MWRFFSRKTILSRLLLLGSLLLTAGCGGSYGVVFGKISYKGKPLKGGTISFIPASGGVVTVSIQEDGSYKINRVPIGPVTITVSTLSIRPPSKGGGGKPMTPPPGTLPPGIDLTPPGMNVADLEKRYMPIPKQYSDPAKSGLTYIVQRGKQIYDIDLK
ncbi:MAG TPA: hypothetical protein VFA10_31155 [Ktedonobacteraceae bacterium]|nr:hypothetical protein [Ktedonobacteraceae bacterium]